MGRVTSQQFIFIGGDDNSRSALGYNNNYNIGDNSNNGSFSRSMSIKNNTTATATNNSNGISNKSGSNNNNNNNTTTVSSFSLFAQINAKKWSSLSVVFVVEVVVLVIVKWCSLIFLNNEHFST